MQSSTAPGGVEAARSDPFGLWRFPAPAPAVPVYGLEEPAGQEVTPGLPVPPGPEAPGAVWLLELDSRGGSSDLEERARRLTSLENTLASAPGRLELALSRAAYTQSFSPGGPEQLLTAGMAAASQRVSYGLGAPDWDALRERFGAMFESVDRQVLHFVWVDTNLDGRLAARTVAGWGGDFSTCFSAGLPGDALDAHQRSLDLAMKARLTTLRAALATIQLAARIALLAATPIAPIQALALAWQFFETVMGEN